MPQEKQPQKPEKKYYTVEVEALIPAVVKYRVLAESPELAVDEAMRAQPIERPTLRLPQMRKLKARVYNWGTNMLKHMRSF